jgi:chemotaxis protein histidine kinase CheA
MRQGEVLKMIKAFTYWMQWRVKVRNTATRGIARCWMLWIWGLLGRFEETRAADESVVVRELGKAAVASLKALKEGIEAAEVEAEAEAEEEYEEEVLEEEVTEEAAAEGDDGAYQPPEFMGEPSNAEEALTAKPAPEEPEEGELEEGEEMEVDVAKPTIEAPEEPEEGELEEGEEPEPKTEAPKQEAPATTVEVDHQVLSLEDTMASLDMIISIVGDFFGQRDLLEDRAAMK